MSPEEIKEALRLHYLWVTGSSEGKKAYLREAYLQEADLQEAYLRGADLRGANLREADLQGANLRGADLRGANLRGANLRGANLRGANLQEANLQGAYLWGADLREADLQGANLRGADLQGAKLPHFQIPAGDLIVYKKLKSQTIATLKVESHFERTATLVGRKCRCSGALVLALSDGTEQVDSRGTGTKYKVGEHVYPDKYDGDIRVECTHGIHFFLTRKEAEEY